LKPFGGCEARVKPSRSHRSHQRAFFFTMETKYLEQIEDALINAAIEKQIELERNGTGSDNDYAQNLEYLLRYAKRDYWIKRGIALFSNKQAF
jgi:hypothetical protein